MPADFGGITEQEKAGRAARVGLEQWHRSPMRPERGRRQLEQWRRVSGFTQRGQPPTVARMGTVVHQGMARCQGLHESSATPTPTPSACCRMPSMAGPLRAPAPVRIPAPHPVMLTTVAGVPSAQHGRLRCLLLVALPPYRGGPRKTVEGAAHTACFNAMMRRRNKAPCRSDWHYMNRLVCSAQLHPLPGVEKGQYAAGGRGGLAARSPTWRVRCMGRIPPP